MIPGKNVCLLLFNNHYYSVTSLSAWYGRNYYCIECEVCYNGNHSCKPIRKCSKCSQKCLPMPTFTRCCKCFGAFRNSTCSRNHLANGVCDNSMSCGTLWYIGLVFDHVCNISYCSYCSKFVKPDHQCVIEVKRRADVKSWRYVSYDFECIQNTLDAETNRPVHKVNYWIAMSICDKCPDAGSCDECLPVHTFSGLGDQNALESLCKWAFDNPVNRAAVFIAYNSSNYNAHFILSYLIRNGEYPEILANDGKLLQMNIKTCNATLIDSYCFIAMPLSRFSDTFNIHHIKGEFTHMFNVSDYYNYVGPLPALRYYDPDVMKQPLRIQRFKWHKAHENDVFDFAKEIHKSGCIMFRNAFITYTGIDPIQSCTIASADLNVLRNSHLKPNSIGRVSVNGYRSLRNHSNKSMEWITDCKKSLVFPTATPGLLAVRCIWRKQKRGQTRTTNPHVMNTSWPSWDVISMDVICVLICQQWMLIWINLWVICIAKLWDGSHKWQTVATYYMWSILTKESACRQLLVRVLFFYLIEHINTSNWKETLCPLPPYLPRYEILNMKYSELFWKFTFE